MPARRSLPTGGQGPWARFLTSTQGNDAARRGAAAVGRILCVSTGRYPRLKREQSASGLEDVTGDAAQSEGIGTSLSGIREILIEILLVSFQ